MPSSQMGFFITPNKHAKQIEDNSKKKKNSARTNKTLLHALKDSDCIQSNVKTN